MEYLLSTLRCVTPCITPVLSFLGLLLTVGYIRSRMIYRGPMPSDGPEEGFASKQARIDYYSTTEQRYRETVKAIIVWVLVGIAASVIVWLASTYNVSITK